MKTTAILTTTLTPRLAIWLKEESKRTRHTKRHIIETALTTYQLEQKRRDLADSFDRVSKDPEMFAIADEGIEDFLIPLTSEQ